jgi:hypothetical protein
MRGNGITYDTGFLSAGTSTREPFDPEVVRRELRVIRDDLHCTAVRITGGYADRLKIVATHAADAGLEVWLCPFSNGITQGELLDLLADCAEHAEELRRKGAEVVLLTGSELSLFVIGFLPGETLPERVALVADPLRVRPMIKEARARINDFLRQAVDVVRARFGGKVSYASLRSRASTGRRSTSSPPTPRIGRNRPPRGSARTSAPSSRRGARRASLSRSRSSDVRRIVARPTALATRWSKAQSSCGATTADPCG